MKDPYEICRDYMLKPKGMMVWRDVPGYEGLYQISNHGDICNIKTTMLNDSSVHLIRLDKSIQAISRRKLFNAYWKTEERYKGEEQWRKLDHYGNYYISNFNEVKRQNRLVLTKDPNGRVTLFDGKGNRKTVSLIKVFMNTFPPFEIEINHEDKTINYVKKNEHIADSSVQKSA